MRAPDLTSRQRSYLRSLGSTIDPVIMVGKNGLGPSVIEQTDYALAARELVKGRVLETAPTTAEEAAGVLAAATGAALVQVIGRNFLLYRPAKKPRIELP